MQMCSIIILIYIFLKGNDVENFFMFIGYCICFFCEISIQAIEPSFSLVLNIQHDPNFVIQVYIP